MTFIAALGARLRRHWSALWSVSFRLRGIVRHLFTHATAARSPRKRQRLVEAGFSAEFGKTASFGPGALQGLERKLAGLGAAAGLTVLFVDTLENAQAYADAGGVAFIDTDTPFAVIARKTASGRLLWPEQIVAHETGHLLGLAHTPATTPDGAPNVDLMHPRGCLHCGFTDSECETMRTRIQSLNE